MARRPELVRRYRQRLAEVRGLTIPCTGQDVERGSHFDFAILLESGEVRGRVSRDLAERGIQTTHCPVIGSLSACRDHAGQPRAEDLAARHLLLPLSSVFTDRGVDLVVGHVTRLLGQTPSRPAERPR